MTNADFRGATKQITLVFCAMVVWAGPPDSPAKGGSLGDASLEELLNTEVVSVSRKEQKLSKAPAAVYVISREEIRRSGVASLPEALRLAPGVQVSRLDLSDWAVSVRGFNGRWSNKLLVLIDGRPIYNFVFSGVLWNCEDTALEDIDRIEVIRGPGATMWGANAVNGVINIVTLSSRDTQGGLLVTGTGDTEPGYTVARYGGTIGKRGTYRITGKSVSRQFAGGSQSDGEDHDQKDRWNAARMEFRADIELTGRDTLMTEGGGFGSTVHDGLELFQGPRPGDTLRTDVDARPAGGFLLGRWTHRYSDTSELALQVHGQRGQYIDNAVSARFGQLDFDLQHQFALGHRHRLLWGLESRSGWYRFDPRPNISFSHSGRDQLWAAFAQDDVELLPDRLRFTFGAKYEHNSYSGSELEPSAQLSFTPDARHTWWVAAGRAVRSPSVADTALYLRFPVQVGPSSVVINLSGNPRMASETLLSYEAGHRAQISKRLSLDVAGFYGVYSDLRSTEPVAPTSPPQPGFTTYFLRFNNGLHGASRGLEASSTWNLNSRWRLTGSYTWLRLRLFRDAGSNDPWSTLEEGESPNHQAQLRSYWNLSKRLEFDAGAFFVSRLKAQQLPSYLKLSARLGWRLSSLVEIQGSVENLLNRTHYEFLSPHELSGYQSEQFGRSVSLRVLWRY